jgi:hypothetical protein
MARKMTQSGFKIGFNKRPLRRICQLERDLADQRINSIRIELEIRNFYVPAMLLTLHSAVEPILRHMPRRR